jgi:HAD superfamily hydrolase (TIGR01459 family)
MDDLARTLELELEFEALRKRYISGVSSIVDLYDVFIFDIFGTLCDGRMSVFEVQEVLQKLRVQNKEVVFFSNMPRPGKVGLIRLEDTGLLVRDFCCYTSADHFLDEFSFSGKSFFHLGAERNTDLFYNLSQEYQQEKEIKDAEYIVLTAFSHGDHDPYHSHILQQLQIAFQRKATVLCINPDREVAMSSLRYPSGYFAHCYMKWGGNVVFYGKPCQSSYAWLLKRLAEKGYHDVQRMLMVGDNLSTDIEGGNSIGMSTAWVLSGILPEQKSPFVMPTYVLNAVKW